MDSNGNILIEILEAEVYSPAQESFKIFFADDMTTVKAKKSDGTIIPFDTGGGSGVSIYTDNDSLTADRTLTGAGFFLKMLGVIDFEINATNDIDITGGNDLNLIATAGTINFDLPNATYINLNGQSFAQYSSSHGEIRIGAAPRRIRDMSEEFIISTLLRVSNIRSAGSPNNKITLGSAHSMVRSGDGGESSSVIFNRFTTASNALSSSTLTQIDNNGTIHFRVGGGGKIRTPNIPVYINVTSAQADGSLLAGDHYRTTAGNADSDSMIRIKI